MSYQAIGLKNIYITINPNFVTYKLDKRLEMF